ncbi:cell division protein SepF [Cellulomonas denverensis]|uniref:Cell division protein SepF n=1 Tax=Cellulomonas denverensis TaxID=264297 RepID=A0A7X6KX56_9CELL|nr:cell division protein SepF [Cellulomonas denverensis]NKY23851.1 cell division protein SepF [Cellulomonas denverensis]GIG25141.1 cell division protein SepF [Cellulomonas denverensis]
MAGALRKTMLYLGLADDRGEHEQYVDEYDEPEAPMVDDYEAEVTPLRPQPAPSRPVADTRAGEGEIRRITTIHPRSYNDARKIGEAFRAGTPVIMNLSDMDDSDAKRLVDFAAGLIFGLHGAIERVTNKVFLLSPSSVEISGGVERPGETSRGSFFNQS